MKQNKLYRLMILIVIVCLAIPASVSAKPESSAPKAPPTPVTFTILHHNDFHGQLEPSGSNPGLARLSNTVNTVRSAVGDGNVLLVDAGDEMQGSLLSNIWQGEPVIAAYNLMGYDAATFGNHEFDWGQTVLVSRTTQADYPYVSANIVISNTGNCDTAGWTSPAFAIPYTVVTVGDPVTVTVGFIGVTTQETPYITIAEATEGLCFKDPAESILHYYDELKAQADVIVVLSHLGLNDGGYGYGFSVYGDKTLAQKLIDAGKPANLIIGGHSHTDLTAPVWIPSDTNPQTAVVQAHYNGRKLGRADITVNPDGSVGVVWTRLVINTTDPQDPAVQALITQYATDPDYLALINQPIGYAQTDLLRNYNGDSMMGDFVDDAIYNQLNADGDDTNDVDLFFNNAGGIRIDWCDKEDPANPGEYIWSSDPVDCQPGLWTHDPLTMTYGMMFQILPFGNATIVGDMTGSQILDLLNQSATLFKGAIQPAGMRFSFYRYSDALPGPQPWAWGGYDACVTNRDTGVCEPLEMDRTYRVGTNEFLAPAGQDGYVQFKYMTNISYWGDMLDSVNAWVEANYTFDNPYKGPDGDGTLDGRITRDGNDAGGSIIPITFLHHNDSHGNLVKGAYLGYTQLASLIKQERAHNPNRTLLLNTGDSIQGDSMMYYFKSASLGYAADGTPLPPSMMINPLIKAFNAMNYDAMTLGNHEFNFGHEIFTSTMKLANFPVLQANLTDDGQYGIAEVPVQPYVEKTVGPESVRVAILGIGNHRIPNYELPSNIPGLTFTNPISKTQELSDQLRASNDIVLALTHIGFTENPGSVEVDKNVDTNLAATVTGIDAIIGGHSHTDPSKQTAASGLYKFLPTIVGGPSNTPVLINQAYRYNNYLGEVVLGVRPKATEGFGYDVVSRAGRYIAVNKDTTPEDPEIQAIAAPYVALLQSYNNTVIGLTEQPIDTTYAYVAETNAANLQTDASVHELEFRNSIPVDFHLSGAMTRPSSQSNWIMFPTATPANPVQMMVSDMFTLMPYENSLVVMEMNGPQLKTVLERAYRNYYYYKYVPGYGGYSYYTTCMLDINAGGEITYLDTSPALPNGNNVLSLVVNGQPIDFNDPDTTYRVSTVNYLAAGSCNFNDSGVSLWPLDQIVNDTQFYVRDAVIHYAQDMGTISPVIEDRLVFEAAPDLSTSVKSVTGLALPGETLTYTIQISNTGGVNASVWLTDSLPVGLTYVPDSLVLPDIFTGTVDGNVLTAQTIADLGLNSSVTIEFQATVGAGIPAGEIFSNLIELSDQMTSYLIPAAEIPMGAYYGVTLEPPSDGIVGNPGDVVEYALELSNTGNVTDTFDLEAVLGDWEVTLPFTETSLAAFASTTFTVSVTIPVDAMGGDTDMVTLNATSQADPTATAASELTTTAQSVYGVTLEPPSDGKVGNPGRMVEYALELSNTGNTTDTFDLEAVLGDWEVTLPFTQTTLAAFTSTIFTVQVMVPLDAVGGATDVVTLIATSQADPTATASSELTTEAEAVFGFIFIPAEDAKTGVAGTVVDYTLHLTNTSNITETFTFSYTGNTWDVTLGVTSTELASGEGLDILVQVAIPMDALNLATDSVTINVVSGSEEEDSAVLTTTAVWKQVFLPAIYQGSE